MPKKRKATDQQIVVGRQFHSDPMIRIAEALERIAAAVEFHNDRAQRGSLEAMKRRDEESALYKQMNHAMRVIAGPPKENVPALVVPIKNEEK